MKTLLNISDSLGIQKVSPSLSFSQEKQLSFFWQIIQPTLTINQPNDIYKHEESLSKKLVHLFVFN